MRECSNCLHKSLVRCAYSSLCTLCNRLHFLKCFARSLGGQRCLNTIAHCLDCLCGILDSGFCLSQLYLGSRSVCATLIKQIDARLDAIGETCEPIKHRVE